jgi:RHS repeat-associated protein
VEYSASTNDTEKYATYTRDTLTGLDYAANRYYSSIWGRFLSPDPNWASVDLRNPMIWNQYPYALNDPVNGSDPTGLIDETCDGEGNCQLVGGSDGAPVPDSGGSGDTGPYTGVPRGDGTVVVPDTLPCFSASGGACGGTYTLTNAGNGDQLSPNRTDSSRTRWPADARPARTHRSR